MHESAIRTEIRMSPGRQATCICSSDFSRLRNPCSKGTQRGVAITILDHDWPSTIYCVHFPHSRYSNIISIRETLRARRIAKTIQLYLFKGLHLWPLTFDLILIGIEDYWNASDFGRVSKMSLDRVATTRKCIKFVLEIIIVANANALLSQR